MQFLNPSQSIAARIDETDGRASGFDYLRLMLSLSIVLLHSSITSYGLAADQAIFEGPARPLVRMILPAFFALSGFLVAGSLVRSKTLGMFLALRVLRIYPALAVEVLLSAFILGPIVTSLSIKEYFTNYLFFSYLLNITGHIQFLLPGVFEDNPLPNIVNGQLWTVPFELGCYIVLAGIAMLGLKRNRAIGPFFVVIVTISYLFVTLYRHNWVVAPVPGAINGALLIATFLAGVSIYFYKEKLPWNFGAGLASGLLAAVFLGYMPYGDFLAPIPIAYFTVYLGLLNPGRKALLGADYSYGIFLYGFVIQQSIAHFFPDFRSPAFNMALSVPIVLLVAAASWHFVERPAQQFRVVLKRWEERYLQRFRARDPLTKTHAT